MQTSSDYLSMLVVVHRVARSAMLLGVASVALQVRAPLATSLGVANVALQVQEWEVLKSRNPSRYHPQYRRC